MSRGTRRIRRRYLALLENRFYAAFICMGVFATICELCWPGVVR